MESKRYIFKLSKIYARNKKFLIRGIFQSKFKSVRYGEILAVAKGSAVHHHLVSRKQLDTAKNDAAVKREFKYPTPDNEEFSHTQHSPWIQSNGVEECVIKEVVDITVTSELEETFERLLELFEELRVRRVQHENLSASLLLTRLPLLV